MNWKQWLSWRLLGPHCYYDAVRLARRGRSTIVRVVYLTALLVGLGFSYGSSDSITPRNVRPQIVRNVNDRHENIRNQLARIAERYTFAWFALQNLAVLLLTPAYVGSAIAEERERRTLELLHATALTNREIVLGKLAARLLHLAGILLAGLPVLSLIQLWGGVDMPLILGNAAYTLLLLVTVGSICILFSALARTVNGAVIGSYVLLLPIGACFAGFGMEILYDARAGSSGVYVIQNLVYIAPVYGLLSVFFLKMAMLGLRRAVSDGAGGGAIISKTPSLISVIQSAPFQRLTAPYVLPPPGKNALYWKECYLGRRSVLASLEAWVSMLPFLCYIFFMLFVCASFSFTRADGRQVLEFWQASLRCGYYFFLAIYTFGVIFRATSTVARERQQQTLEALLLLPVARWEILRAKLIGCLYKGWPWLGLLLCDVFMGLCFGVFHPVSALLMLLAPLPLAYFFVNLGLMLSVWCQTVLKANLVMVIVVLLLATAEFFGLPGLLGTMSAFVAPWRDSFWPDLPERGPALLVLVHCAPCIWLLDMLTRARFNRRHSAVGP